MRSATRFGGSEPVRLFSVETGVVLPDHLPILSSSSRFLSHRADWPHSTFRRCVAGGLYAAGWTGSGDEPRDTGERH